MNPTPGPSADLASGRIIVRVGEVCVSLSRRSVDARTIPGYRITCEALTNPDETRPGLTEDVDPWFVDLGEELDLRAALRIAEIVANRADEHLGRTRRFREDALGKIDEAIQVEARPAHEHAEADR